MSMFESFYDKMRDEERPEITNIKMQAMRYPVYIKWFEMDENELLIYFNEPVHIKHNSLNNTMSVMNDKNQCLFITHQNNVEYMHVGSQPPVFLAKHMNIPVKKEEPTICDGCHGCIFAGEKCTNPELCVRDDTKLTGYTPARYPEQQSDCRTCFHNGYRCTYPEEITADKNGICSGHTLVNLIWEK